MGQTIYIVFIDSPKITKSTFTKINVLRQTEDEVGEGQIFDYGEILKIDIYTHLIISRDDIKINCSLGGKELDFKRIMHPTFVDDVKYNAVTSLQLHIDPKWRDEVSHGENEVKDLVVSVEIETLEQKKERQMQPSVVKIDKTRVARPMVFPPISEPDLVSNYGEDELKVSYSFQVNYSGNRELITDRNKGIEQMVSILDTKVVQLQDDKPCRYTSILVYELDKESKETRRFIAFSENGNGTVNDSTTTVYCITAGHNENKKDVKIKVGGFCCQLPPEARLTV